MKSLRREKLDNRILMLANQLKLTHNHLSKAEIKPEAEKKFFFKKKSILSMKITSSNSCD